MFSSTGPLCDLLSPAHDPRQGEEMSLERSFFLLSGQNRNTRFRYLIAVEHGQEIDVLKEKVKAIDFDKISTVADLVDAYKDSSVQSRALATCAIAYEKALKTRRGRRSSSASPVRWSQLASGR